MRNVFVVATALHLLTAVSAQGTSPTTAASTAAATPTVIPPAGSGVPTATQQLLVSFQNGTVPVQPGQQLGINVPSSRPQIGLRTGPANNQLYTLAMIDPDAPTPQNPNRSQILHMLEPNMRLVAASTVSGSAGGAIPFLFVANEPSTPPIAPYARPMPPNYSPAHRYILYAFQQPANFTFPSAYSGYSATNRTLFNLAGFAAAAGLGSPLAANYILVSNGTDAIAPTATGTAPGGVVGATGSATASRPAIYTGAAVSFSKGGCSVAGLVAALFLSWV